MTFQEAARQQWDLIVLQGAPGVETMRDSMELIGILAKQKADGKLVGASGAMPAIVLASMHDFLLEGATCFPLEAFRSTIKKASDYDVVVHDNLVASQGIGRSLVFALMLVELLFDAEEADRVAQTMLIDRTNYRYYPPSCDPKVRMKREEEIKTLVCQIKKMEMPCDVYIPREEYSISSHQTICRKQIEFFVAQQEDIDKFAPNRRNEIAVGQVGIRCKHCAVIPHKKAAKGSMYFPKTLNAIYQAANNMWSTHFTGPDACKHITPPLDEQLAKIQEKQYVTGLGGRSYWAKMAAALGVCETEKGLCFPHGNK
jgi:DJ-1/PfpI family